METLKNPQTGLVLMLDEEPFRQPSFWVTAHSVSALLCSDSGCDGTGIQWKENFDSTFTEICEIGR